MKIIIVWILGYFMSMLSCNLLILDMIHESKYKDLFNFDKQFKWVILITAIILIMWPLVVPIFLLLMVCYWIIDILLTFLGCIVVLFFIWKNRKK